MSEKLPARYDATTEWKSVSSERIDDAEKAQVMAEVLMDSAMRDVAYEPTRVEDAGKTYDAYTNPTLPDSERKAS